MKALQSIVAGFNKTLNKLEELARTNLDAVDRNNAQVVTLQQQSHELSTEAKAATDIANNIRKLLNQ